MDRNVARAPATGRKRRSDTTKERILRAAAEVFAEEGFERATIRGIAERATINPAMVMRYFGSKEGLFTAASPFDLDLRDLSKVPRAQLGRTMVRTFLNRWQQRDGAADMPALLRLSVTHPEGRDRAIRVFTEQVRPMLAAVIRSQQPDRVAALIATQIVGLAFLRYVLKLPGVVELSDELLVEHVGAAVQRYLDEPADASDES